MNKNYFNDLMDMYRHSFIKYTNKIEKLISDKKELKTFSYMLGIWLDMINYTINKMDKLSECLTNPYINKVIYKETYDKAIEELEAKEIEADDLNA